MTKLGRSISAILMTGAVALTAAGPTMAQVTGPAPGFSSGCFVSGGFCPIHAGNYLLIPTGVPVSATSAGKATPNWGTTIANIPEMFAWNMYYNFANNVNLNVMFTGMDQYMLARFSTELKAHDTSNYTPDILAHAAQKLSAANLRRLESAVGPALMTSAMVFTTPANLAAYNKLPVQAPLPLSAYWWAEGKGAGVIDQSGDLYMYDLFLDSYTAGAGGSSTPYLADMARYMNYRVKVSVFDIIFAVAALYAIYDSPGAQRLGTAIGDWMYYSYLNDVDGGTNPSPIVIDWPGPIPSPIPDPGIPDLPPISGDNPGGFGMPYVVDCTPGCNAP